MSQPESIEITDSRGGLGDTDRFQAAQEDFRRIRELGKPCVWMVMHPYSHEHMDVVDFDIEINRRHRMGMEGYDFWSTPLPEVDNQ